MNRPVVDYLVARSGPPPPSGLAYDYVLAGDGLYLASENEALAVRLPVARCDVRGLPALGPACLLKGGRLPGAMWEEMVRVAYAWAGRGREVLLVVTYPPDKGYRLVLPPQAVSATGVLYRPPQRAVLELHSHHRFPARFSPTDDADEQRLCLYGVLGRLDNERPEVALRVGAYGVYLPLPWEAVFEGERGPFRDGTCEPVEEETHGLPA